MRCDFGRDRLAPARGHLQVEELSGRLISGLRRSWTPVVAIDMQHGAPFCIPVDFLLILLWSSITLT